jgi:pimeloyl-ACP methyl ester carboxylesterase
MPEVPLNGVRLYYEEHGQGDPILCIHGTSSSAMVWRPAAIDDLATVGRVICYDRRGCTRSERPAPYETSVAQHAEDAMGLLRALDAVPAVVIGRSYGGETAVELALRHPRSVRALVLLEAALLTLDEEAMVWTEGLRAAVEDAAARDASSVMISGSPSPTQFGRCSSTTRRRSSPSSAARGSRRPRQTWPGSMCRHSSWRARHRRPRSAA